MSSLTGDKTDGLNLGVLYVLTLVIYTNLSSRREKVLPREEITEYHDSCSAFKLLLSPYLFSPRVTHQATSTQHILLPELRGYI